MNQLPIVNYLVIALEICAAVFVTFYYRKNRGQDTSSKYLVLLLWTTVVFEIIALFPFVIFTFKSLSSLKDGLFSNNTWVFNILILISYILYIVYFKENLYNKSLKRILVGLTLVFSISTVANLIFSDVFFNELSTLTDVFGSIVLLLSVLFYFYEMLQSEKVLIFYKLLGFYIAIGALVFHLVITPIDIYFEYYNVSNASFSDLRDLVLYSANIFMYTCYIIGFVVCSRKNRSYL